MRKLVILALVAAGLTFGGVTAFSQEGQPRNYAEETKKFNDTVDKALQEAKAGGTAEKEKAGNVATQEKKEMKKESGS